jgi:hypothetical protein
MVTHMKTTIEIADSLLVAAKRLAARRGTTLRAVIEDGLRRLLREQQKHGRFRLRRATFRGEGLNPQVREGGWERVRDLIYQGRGE